MLLEIPKKYGKEEWIELKGIDVEVVEEKEKLPIESAGH